MDCVKTGKEGFIEDFWKKWLWGKYMSSKWYQLKHILRIDEKYIITNQDILVSDPPASCVDHIHKLTVCPEQDFDQDKSKKEKILQLHKDWCRIGKQCICADSLSWISFRNDRRRKNAHESKRSSRVTLWNKGPLGSWWENTARHLDLKSKERGVNDHTKPFKLT